MRYVMKQKLFSWTDSFVIRDGRERDMFQVQGKFFTLGKQLSFLDMAGNELAFIKQRLLSWGPTYEIYRDGALIAEVRKELFTFFHCAFTVDLPGLNDLTANGDFFDHEYLFTRDNEPVAVVSKQWFSWTDTYGVDVSDNEDDILVLASAVVIDQVCHEENK